MKTVVRIAAGAIGASALGWLLNMSAAYVDAAYQPVMIRWGWVAVFLVFGTYLALLPPSRSWISGTWYRAASHPFWVLRCIAVVVFFLCIDYWGVNAFWNQFGQKPVTTTANKTSTPPPKTDVGPTPGPPTTAPSRSAVPSETKPEPAPVIAVPSQGSTETAIAKLTELGWAVNPHSNNNQSSPGSPIPTFTLSLNVPGVPPFEKSAAYLKLISQPFLIHVGGAESLDGIVHLKDIPYFVYLRVYNSNANDLAPIGGLQSLTTLEMRTVAGFTDVSPIAKLSKLEHLTIAGCMGVTDVSPLARLSNLRTLHIDDTRISDIRSLRGMKSLVLLSLTQTAVTDLSPLSELPSLREIGITKEQLTGIADLAESKSLKNISLNLYNPPTGASVDISPLSRMVNISELTIFTTNFIVDINPIRMLKLSRLSLTGLGGPFGNPIRVENIDAIQNVSTLRSLELAGAMLTNISFLTGLDKLEEITLTHDIGLRDIQVLGTLSHLTKVGLLQTPVVDISPLLNLRDLKFVDVRNDPARIDVVMELESRGVRVAH